jgi:hypothetical protein
MKRIKRILARLIMTRTQREFVGFAMEQAVKLYKRNDLIEDAIAASLIIDRISHLFRIGRKKTYSAKEMEEVVEITYQKAADETTKISQNVLKRRTEELISQGIVLGVKIMSGSFIGKDEVCMNVVESGLKKCEACDFNGKCHIQNLILEAEADMSMQANKENKGDKTDTSEQSNPNQGKKWDDMTPEEQQAAIDRRNHILDNSSEDTR